MFRVFNSFQVVCLFSCLPFLAAWLYGNPFQYAQAGFYTAVVAYVVAFIFMVIAVSEFAKESR